MKGRQLRELPSERSNPASRNLDQKSALAIARIINAEDAKVAAAVRRALPQIARAIDEIGHAFAQGGRLIYVGTGTSGRIGALDASECSPTFGTPTDQVQYVIAGGDRALGAAVEASEDDVKLGRCDISRRKPGKHDVVVGIAASGRTPFTIAAIKEARRRGAQTIAVTCNPKSPLERAAHFAIVTEVGPEVIAGSSRMKAGTAEKMVLNMLSTGAMARAGYIYSNLMVHARPRNSKLQERGIAMLAEASGLEWDAARIALRKAGNDVAAALVMVKAGISQKQAIRSLQQSNGNIRKAIAVANRG